MVSRSSSTIMFDLITRELKQIHSLPKESYRIMAVKFNKYFIITGAYMSYLYLYNDATYTAAYNFGIPEIWYLVVSDRWIFIDGKLFKNQDYDIKKWIK